MGHSRSYGNALIYSVTDDSRFSHRSLFYNTSSRIMITSRVSVEGKSSVCVICMKYRIIILIIMIISPGKILLSYCKHITHPRMHARTHAYTHTHGHTHTPTHRCRRSGCRCSMCHLTQVTGHWRSMAGRFLIQINSCLVFAIVFGVFRIYKNC